MDKVIVIGAGFSGLAAACCLAAEGIEVTVLEKHDQAGGRARQLKSEGFTFDMGPSWYWMPGVFERFFNRFGKKTADYYTLKRLSPSYRVAWEDGNMDIPSGYAELRKLFESVEKGSARKLDKFLDGAAKKYAIGMERLAYQPALSLKEFVDKDVIRSLLQLDLFNSMSKHIGKYFNDPKLRQILSFPVLFLGAMPDHIPALYSLMNYADIKLGTWYPVEGGMYSIVKAMQSLATSLGVAFEFQQDVAAFEFVGNKVTNVVTAAGKHWEADGVVATADYHFIEQELLPPSYRTYSDSYWTKRDMAPSCLLYYIGLNKKLPGLQHHSLFFDAPFDQHAADIYKSPKWPDDPLFYACCTSVSDETVAPPGCENLFLLIPVAPGLSGDTVELREFYFEKIIKRMEKHLQTSIMPHIIFQQHYATSNFMQDYNAFKGNAYGLANTLTQTALLKPSLRSRKVKNLIYAGQLTVPGPGVPPAIISGEIAAGEILKTLASKNAMMI